jgi:hypothetical protein
MATDPMRDSAALIAACDRICGLDSRYHKDRCPLYKANCEAMSATNLVTLNREQTPIAAVSADDPLVRSVVAYTGRMRAEAARLRDLADKYDALADNSDPTPVITPGYGSAAEAHAILLSWADVAAERGLDAWAARMLRVAADLPCGCGVRCA